MAIRLNDPGDEAQELAEINITPFIDVMLVLLIIFMVAAPLSTVDMKVQLPAMAGTPAPRPVEKVMVTLQADLGLMVNGVAVTADGLSAALNAAAAGNFDQPLYLGADAGVAYGDLMALMNRLQGAGFAQIGLVGLEAAPAPATAPTTP